MALLSLNCHTSDNRPRVLIFHKTEFYAHDCLNVAIEAVRQLCERNGWATDATEWGEDFTEENLSKYAAIIFLLTAGDVLSPIQEVVFERFVQGGGGFVGVYTAVDTEHNWPWYRQLVGAEYDGLMPVQSAQLSILDRDHPATAHLEQSWTRTDEWMNLKNVLPDINVLLTLDESSCTGGKMGAFHPVSWYHEFDGGRAFVTVMGHTAESYQDTAFLKHLEGGLKYAVGAGNPIVLGKHRPFRQEKKVKAGFVKTSVVCNLAEPMSMAMFPDGKILLVERRGAIKLFNPADGTLKKVAEIEVFQKNEEGLLGVAIDPKWSENSWIYLYYAPAKKPHNSSLRLSRFVFKDDVLYLDSEKVILEVPTDRDLKTLHAAGCLRFDKQGFLYLSTGDNTNHYGDGYTAIDERPEARQYDAQKSASNSMDLRGKILRIKPLPDGSYICPAGNLYVEEDIHVYPGNLHLLYDPAWEGIAYPMSKPRPVPIAKDYPQRAHVWTGRGRPEIYIMGCRNPFRMDFDHRRGLLIWGEPGPDAGVSDSLRGPEGFDEINIARRAGFYGWPYCIGPNLPYREYSYATGSSGPYFNPERPENDSPNNTGDRHLPPSQPALIWYPFKSSELFPLVLNGTRCAMAGPAYYCDEYPEKTRFPKRFDGKILIYEWMRNWIMAVELDSLDRYVSMQPVAPNVRLGRPIDLLIDKNGSLWVLEYGTEWFTANPDACLSRIDYIRDDMNTDEVAETPPTNQPPSVEWLFGARNGSFYSPGDTIKYALYVSDPEDGSLADGRISPSDVELFVGYLSANATFKRPSKRANNHQEDPVVRGQKLVNESDCRSCHAIERKINGPAYRDVARRYKDEPRALEYLIEKIIKGGKGVWGEVAMSAHPQLAKADVRDMVRWILSLDNSPRQPFGHGTLVAPASVEQDTGRYVFHARYTDRGAFSQAPQTTEALIWLRPSLVKIGAADSLSKGVETYERPLNNASVIMHELKSGDFFMLKAVDAQGLKGFSIALEVTSARHHLARGRIEARLGSPNGPLVGVATLPISSAGGGLSEVTLELNRKAWPASRGRQDVYFIARTNNSTRQPICAAAWLKALL
ncbi:MAG: ThuA domain-containing protein [Saprospiraceae bacterium]|nr:ThuA domain-containing protein [Saprospiraceae bacterium]MDW8483395.1 ThuA domain-containing protein [Saprospiraceae bacterium]